MSKKHKTSEAAEVMPEPFVWWQGNEEADGSLSISKAKQALLQKWHGILVGQVEEQYGEVMMNELSYIVSHVGTLNDAQRLKEYFQYLSAHPNVIEMKEDWKDEVTEKKIRGFGFKVGGKRRAPDDMLYRKNPDLQYLLPRGLVFVQDVETREYELALFSNRKFFGRTNNDDDDSDLVSTTLRSGQFTHFLESNKANGESSQIALLSDGRTWVIGSKNRKILVRAKSEVALYDGAQMYSYAVEMARRWFDYLADMGATKEEELRELFMLTRWTMNFEFETPEHQHLVPLYEKKLVLIGCTGIHVKGTSVHPIFAAALGRYFGLPSVLRDTTTYGKDKVDALCKDIAHRWCDEGSVLILLDDQQRPVDFVKVKTFWYILLRAIREKVRQLAGQNAAVARACNRIEVRLNELQRSMKIPKDIVAVYKSLGVKLAVWMAEDPKRIDRFKEGQYPILWLEFLASEGLPSDSSLLEQNIAAPTRRTLDLPPLLVMTQGIPGVGKSRLAMRLVETLTERGTPSIQVAQDDFAHHGKKSSGMCYDHIISLLEGQRYKVVVLARNNSSYRQYDKYAKLDGQGLCRAVFIGFEEFSTRADELAYLCVASVLFRKAAGQEEHPTNSMDDVSLAGLPLRFLSELELHRSAFTVRCLREEALDIPRRSQFSALVQKVQKSGIKNAGLSKALLADFGLTAERNAVTVTCRRPMDEVVTDMITILDKLLDVNSPPLGSYFSASLSTESQLAFSDAVQEALQLSSGFPASWNVFCDHVTLQHSVNFYQNQENWGKLSAFLGEAVTVTPTKLVFDGKIAVLEVTVRLLSTGESLDAYVTSKVPHITVSTAPGSKAVQAADVVRAATPEQIVSVDKIPAGEALVELVNG